MYPPLPLKLVEVRGDEGIIETGGERYPVNLHFLDNVLPGDNILVQMGFGIQPSGLQKTTGSKNPSVINLRTEIENVLSGTEFTVLLTSGLQIANLRLHKILYSLPPYLHFVYGPGCPTCLTPAGYYRDVFQLAQKESVILVTFNDVMNMPTTEGTLQSLRMAGNDVRLVHSPYDVLRIAEWNPSREVVLAAVGYDIMTATVGVTLKEAVERDIKNVSFFLSLQKRDVLLRDFILHTSHPVDGVIFSAYDVAAAGINSYDFIVRELERACSCAGFTAEDVLGGVLDVIRQSKSKELVMQQGASCICSASGNPRIRSAINDVFMLSDARWATDEIVKQSRYMLRDTYRSFDAERKFNIQPDTSLTMPGCNSREIQLGLKIPSECPNFANGCTPAHPVGPGMLTTDGLCNSWYHSSIKVKNVF